LEDGSIETPPLFSLAEIGAGVVQALAGISRHISVIMLITMFAPYVHSFFIQDNISVVYKCEHARLSSPDYHGTSDNF
jgi:hypothetical protein